MHSAIIITVFIVSCSLLFDFINGFHDTAVAVATSISTRALKPKTAIIICAVCNFLGAFSSTEVAKNVGDGIVDSGTIPQWVILCVIIQAIIWNLITWYFAIPSSSSHALIGSLVGGGLAYTSKISAINWTNLFDSVILWIFISPVIGFFVGYILMVILNWILKPFKVKVINNIFLKLQVVSGAFMALNHGANDSQKSMGLITLALVTAGLLPEFSVPLWVILACAIAMALGTSIGGKKIIKTMGSGMAKLTPVNGFAAQTGSACVILAATMFHAPVSTTQIVTTTIMGVGASKRFKSVKWGMAKKIVTAWLITIPITAILSAILVSIVKVFIQ